MHNNLIQQQLATLSLGEAQWVNNLALYPLLAEADAAADYLTLDEALGNSLARVTEVSESGQVPELVFENLSDKAVLLLDGEELVGAKQNRVLNVTLLVPGNTRLTIPVSCVEMGRWSRTSHEFASSGRALFARARAAKMEQVSFSLRESGTRRSDQGAIWDDIDAKMARMNVGSSTRAMNDIYKDSSARLQDYERGFKPVAKQVGSVFAIGGRIAGMELFDAPPALPPICPSWCEAMRWMPWRRMGETEPAETDETASAFLRQLSDCPQERYRATGAGEDVRLAGEGVAGGALEHEGRLIHLAAYRTGVAHEPAGAED